MENMDFDGTTNIVQSIEKQRQEEELIIIEEKKIDEPQMMEFSSSVADLVPPPSSSSSQDVYTNPTNHRVTGLSLSSGGGGDQSSQKKSSSGNPFNLTDDQFNAFIAGIVAVIVYSNSVQMKLSTLVPNFSGMNGNIASALLAAVIFFFAHRFIKNR